MCKEETTAHAVTEADLQAFLVREYRGVGVSNDGRYLVPAPVLLNIFARMRDAQGIEDATVHAHPGAPASAGAEMVLENQQQVVAPQNDPVRRAYESIWRRDNKEHADALWNEIENLREVRKRIIAFLDELRTDSIDGDTRYPYMLCGDDADVIERLERAIEGPNMAQGASVTNMPPTCSLCGVLGATNCSIPGCPSAPMK